MDVDGDGQVDLVWHNRANGELATWLLNGLTLREVQRFSVPSVPDTAWRLVGPK
jgi:hypothetical protein